MFSSYKHVLLVLELMETNTKIFELSSNIYGQTLHVEKKFFHLSLKLQIKKIYKF